MIVCKGENCEAINGVLHSDECEAEHSDAVNPDSLVIRKAIERYCIEVRDPRKGCMMITNAADMLEWLLAYDSKQYSEEPKEIFAGTNEALSNLTITKTS